MISEKMQKALNEQVKNEIYSAHLYLAMSSWSSREDLDGFANWFRVQYQEEMTHAFKLYDYIVEQDGTAVVQQIDQPPQDFGSPKKAMEATLEHEKKVTAMIHDLVNLARDEKDHATEIMLQWFVTEQVEEEASANKILSMLKRCQENPGALFMIDQQLGQRVFNDPTTEAEA